MLAWGGGEHTGGEGVFVEGRCQRMGQVLKGSIAGDFRERSTESLSQMM